MGPGSYNCNLDKQTQSNLLCYERFYSMDEDGHVMDTTVFYNSIQFAKQQAGLAWRAQIEESIDIEDIYFDYHMNSHVIDEVAYGNNTRSLFVPTNAPCWVGPNHEIDAAAVLNNCVDAWSYRKDPKQSPDCLGFREYKVLKHIEQLWYVEEDKVFEAVDVDGDEFSFRIVPPCNIEVVG